MNVTVSITKFLRLPDDSPPPMPTPLPQPVEPLVGPNPLGWIRHHKQWAWLILWLAWFVHMALFH